MEKRDYYNDDGEYVVSPYPRGDMLGSEKIQFWLSSIYSDCIRKNLDYLSNFVESFAGKKLSVDLLNSTISIDTRSEEFAEIDAPVNISGTAILKSAILSNFGGAYNTIIPYNNNEDLGFTNNNGLVKMHPKKKNDSILTEKNVETFTENNLPLEIALREANEMIDMFVTTESIALENLINTTLYQ